MRKNVQFIAITVILSLSFLVACGTTESVQEDALSELEAITTEGADIEVTLSIQLQPKANLSTTQLPEADVEWTYFTGTTPKGKKIKGIILLAEDLASLNLQQLGNFEIQDLKVRGKVTSLNGIKVFSGFYTNSNKAIGSLIAYNATENLNTFDNEATSSFEAKAELVTRNGSTVMLARAKDGIIMSLISEDLGLADGVTKEDVTVELMAQIDGFVSQGSANVTLPGLGKVNVKVVGVFVHISA